MEHEYFFMKIIYEKMFQVMANVLSYMWKSHNAENLNITENIWRKLNV